MNMGYELTTMKNADQQISLLKTVENTTELNTTTLHTNKTSLTHHARTYTRMDSTTYLCKLGDTVSTYINYKLVYTVLIGKILS